MEREREREIEWHNVKKRGYGSKKTSVNFFSQIFLWNTKRRICGECFREGEGLLMCLSLEDLITKIRDLDLLSFKMW